jgi:hypothetical protein
MPRVPSATWLAMMLCTGAFALVLDGSPIVGAEPAVANPPAQRVSASGPRLPEIDVSGAPDGIVPLPDDVDDVFKVFDRYTKVIAPNGKPIHILVEPGYTDRQVVYARKVLVNHLTDLRGSKYGADKAAIANSMADSNAILVLFYSTETMRRPAAREYFRSGVNTQDLREYETIIEGSAGYMDQDDPTRDASYEEILHLVQGYGIEPADRLLADTLQSALVSAQAGDIYLLAHDESYEYFICALEAYYDMWRHDPGGNGIREAEYVPISRVSLAEVDPTMYEVIEEFFGEFWMYTAEIASEFEGTFSLTFDDAHRRPRLEPDRQRGGQFAIRQQRRQHDRAARRVRRGRRRHRQRHGRVLGAVRRLCHSQRRRQNTRRRSQVRSGRQQRDHGHRVPEVRRPHHRHVGALDMASCRRNRTHHSSTTAC